MDPDMERMVQALREVGDVLQCRRCGLHESRAHVVVGSGPAPAAIMLIGEAPGKNEDKQGMPFVGAAGRSLDALLKESGIAREDVYITNIVKCRPPDNRPPTAAEAEACLPYLREQLSIVRPRAVVLMGRTAAGTLLGRQVSPGREHGSAVDADGIRYFISYHPAAMIYRRTLRETMVDDLKRVSAFLADSK